MNELNARTYFATVIIFAVFLGVFQMLKTKIVPIASSSLQPSCQQITITDNKVKEQTPPNQQIAPKSMVAYWPARTLPLKEIRIYALPFDVSLQDRMSVRSLMKNGHSYQVRLDHPKSLERFRQSISTLRVSRESENLDHRVACLITYVDGSKEVLGMDPAGNIFLSGIKFERSESMYHLLTTWIPASYYH